MRPLRGLSLYGHYLLLGFRSQAEYRVDLALMIFGVTVLNAVDVALLAVILTRFPALGGWSFWEVAFLYCLYLAALGLENTFLLHLVDIDELIRDGTLDHMLLRPRPVLLQMLAKDISPRDLAQVGLGLGGAWYSLHRLGLALGVAHWALLLAYLVAGAAVLGGIVLAICSVGFWTVRSRVFLAGTGELQEVVQHYPAHVFGQWFVGLVTLVLPFAAINYYPAAALLGKPTVVSGPLLALLPFLAAAGCLTAGGLVWRLGLRSYLSTGT